MPLPQKIPSGERRKARKEIRILANRYKVERRLGKGNYGTAWLVRDIIIKDEKEKLKVVKEIPVASMSPNETLEADREARLLRVLGHPNIVRFYDSFLEDEYFGLVTEFCDGGDLEDVIIAYRKEKIYIAEPQVTDWLIQLLLAVDFMHKRKILHRDLKTRNIFLRTNKVKVGDFGISRILMGTNDMATTFTGTPYYMSPEVLKHNGYNSKSDIWSLAVILYRMVSLEYAFGGDNMMAVMYAICEARLPTWPEGYSTQLEEVFRRMLQREPEMRPSATDVLKMPHIANKIIYPEREETVDVIAQDTKALQTAHQNPNKLSDLAKDKKSWKNLTPREKFRLQKMAEVDSKQSEVRRVPISTSDDTKSAKKLKNMTPRERMQARKRMEADAKGEKMRTAAQQQQEANQMKYYEMKTSLDPYQTHVVPVWSGGKQLENRKRESPGFDEVHNALFTRMRRRENEIEDSSEESEEEGTEMPTVVFKPKPNRQSSLDITKSPIEETGYDGGGNQRKHHSASADDRPITPMKNQEFYSRPYSSLDFEDGVPGEPGLAETYYSQFEDEFEPSSDEDKEELCKQLEALNNDDLAQSHTLTDDTVTGPFGPGARDKKIRNIRNEAEKDLGKNLFDRAYRFLKEVKYSGPSKMSDEDIDKELNKMSKKEKDFDILKQLLFLECQAEISLQS